MNIKDLPQGSYTPVSSPKLNINNLPKADITPVTPNTTLSLGGVTLNANYSQTANKTFQPNLSSNPLVAGAQQIGTNVAKGLFDAGAGIVKGGAETVRQLGETGTSIQGAINTVAGTKAPITEQFAQGGAFDQATTPDGAIQKSSYSGETAAEIIPVGGKIATTITKPILRVVGKGVEKLVAENIPKTVETALKNTPKPVFDKYAEASVKATTDNHAFTPLEVAGQTAQGSLDTIQRKLGTIGSEKAQVLGQASVGNKPVGNIAVKFRQNLNNYLSSKTAVEGDSKLIREINTEAQRLGNNPQAKEVDKFIDFVQDRIYTSNRDLSVPVTDETTSALRRMVGELNGSLKDQLPDSYKNLNAKYADIVDVRNELNTKLGKEGEKGGALMKRVFSPSDANTKQLFARVKEITGVDLIDEATVARYTMEASGDARQASLLEQLQLPKFSKEGILDYLYKKATARFNTPSEKLKRARGLTTE